MVLLALQRCVLATTWLAFAVLENVQCPLQAGSGVGVGEGQCTASSSVKLEASTGNSEHDRSSEYTGNPPYTHQAVATLDGDPTAGFNGNPALKIHSNWISKWGQTKDEWIVYDLGTTSIVTSIRISNRPGHGIKNVHLQLGGSKEDDEWMTEWSFQVPNQPGDSFLPPFVGSAPIVGRWFRLYIVDSWGGPL